MGGDRVCIAKPGQLGDTTVKLFDLASQSKIPTPTAQVLNTHLVMVTVKQSQEASLRACRALDTTEAEIVSCALDVAQIPEELLFPRTVGSGRIHRLNKRSPHLNPECSTLPDGGQLGGLEMREPERGEVAVLLRERRKAVNHGCEFCKEKRECFADEDEVRVAIRRMTF